MEISEKCAGIIGNMEKRNYSFYSLPYIWIRITAFSNRIKRLSIRDRYHDHSDDWCDQWAGWIRWHQGWLHVLTSDWFEGNKKGTWCSGTSSPCGGASYISSDRLASISTRRMRSNETLRVRSCFWIARIRSLWLFSRSQLDWSHALWWLIDSVFNWANSSRIGWVFIIVSLWLRAGSALPCGGAIYWSVSSTYSMSS